MHRTFSFGLLSALFSCHALQHSTFGASRDDDPSAIRTISQRLRHDATTDIQRAADLDFLRRIASDNPERDISLRARLILLGSLDRAEDVREAISLATEASELDVVRADQSLHAAWIRRVAWAHMRALTEYGVLPTEVPSISSPGPLPVSHRDSFDRLVAATEQYLELVLPSEPDQPVRAGGTAEALVSACFDVVQQCLRFNRSETALALASRAFPVITQNSAVLSQQAESRLGDLRVMLASAHLAQGNVDSALEMYTSVSSHARISGSAALNAAVSALGHHTTSTFLHHVLVAEANQEGQNTLAPTQQWISCVLMIDPSALTTEQALDVVAKIDLMLTQSDHPGLREYGANPSDPIIARDNLIEVRNNYAIFRLNVAKLAHLKHAGQGHSQAVIAQKQAISQQFPRSQILVEAYLR